MKKVISVIVVLFTLISCNPKEVDGIIIGNNIEYKDNFGNKISDLIKLTLQKDQNSLRRLKNYGCQGGASCYDLGYVITQIIYKLGETEFISIIDNLDEKELFGIEGLIEVGLEYGDNNYDGKMDNKKFENEFPTLKKVLSNKNL